MSKSTVTRLFIGAALAMIVGLVITAVAIVTAVASGTVTIGGPAVVTVNGSGFAGMVVWLLIAAVAFSLGAVLGIASWIGALLNTYQLEDKTWFLAVLVLGAVSLGWVAVLAYVIAGPDGPHYATGPRRVATTPGA
jgi:hypothetical protein